MNSLTIIIACVAGGLFVAFLLHRNIKDGRRYRQQLMDDYHKSKDKEKDVETGDEP